MIDIAVAGKRDKYTHRLMIPWALWLSASTRIDGNGISGKNLAWEQAPLLVWPATTHHQTSQTAVTGKGSGHEGSRKA